MDRVNEMGKIASIKPGDSITYCKRPGCTGIIIDGMEGLVCAECGEPPEKVAIRIPIPGETAIAMAIWPNTVPNKGIPKSSKSSPVSPLLPNASIIPAKHHGGYNASTHDRLISKKAAIIVDLFALNNGTDPTLKYIKDLLKKWGINSTTLHRIMLQWKEEGVVLPEKKPGRGRSPNGTSKSKRHTYFNSNRAQILNDIELVKAHSHPTIKSMGDLLTHWEMASSTLASLLKRWGVPALRSYGRQSSESLHKSQSDSKPESQPKNILTISDADKTSYDLFLDIAALMGNDADHDSIIKRAEEIKTELSRRIAMCTYISNIAENIVRLANITDIDDSNKETDNAKS